MLRFNAAFSQAMLTVDPSKRITASQALEHPWMKHGSGTLEVRNLAANLEMFRLFNARRKVRLVCIGFELPKVFADRHFAATQCHTECGRATTPQ
jgi:calcium/calmodulin-dependent protein kinase (CaM kinase) II